MTILVGYVDHEENEVYLGTDTLWVFGESFGRAMGEKFIDVPQGFEDSENILMAQAGEDMYALMFDKFLKKIVWDKTKTLVLLNKSDVLELSLAFHEFMKSHGVGGPESNAMPSHANEIMIVSKRMMKIWTIEDDYSVSEFDTYAAGGSGYQIGEASLATSQYHGIGGEEAVKAALMAAIDLHVNCGGDAVIRSL